MFASGAITGAMLAVSVAIANEAAAWGVLTASVASDITGYIMYYYHYGNYGQTQKILGVELKVGNMKITKGQFSSMVVGTIAGCLASFAAGKLSKSNLAGKMQPASSAEGAETAAPGGSASNIATNTATTASSSINLQKLSSAGLISGIASATMTLIINIAKSVLKLSLKSLGKGFIDFVKSLGKAAANFFYKIIHPGQYIKLKINNLADKFKAMKNGRQSLPANPSFRYGRNGDYGQLLKQIASDLMTNFTKMFIYEYIRQNLEHGIYTKKGKKIIGPVDEAVASMVADMVSKEVTAGVSMAVHDSAAKITHQAVDAQLGFVKKGEFDPNKSIEGLTESGGKQAVSLNQLANDKKLMESVSGGKQLTATDTFDIDVAGQNVTVRGDQIDASMIKQLQAFSNFNTAIGEAGKNANTVLSNTANKKPVTVQELHNAGIEITAKGTISAKKADRQGMLLVTRNDNSKVKVDITGFDANDIKSITNYSKSMDTALKTAGEYGLLVMGDPRQSITINVTNIENRTIPEAEAFKLGIKKEAEGNLSSITGTLVTADGRTIKSFKQSATNPGFIELEVFGPSSKRNIDIQTFAGLSTIAVSDNKIEPNKMLEFTLAGGSRVAISGEAINGTVLNKLKGYHTLLNSTTYRELFQMTGGLPYNINGEDINTMSVTRASFEAVRNMGLSPVVATATRIALLELLSGKEGFHIHRGDNRHRIFENSWKMAVAGAGANIVTDAFNNLDSLQEKIYGLGSGQNHLRSRGQLSYAQYIGKRTLEESGALLSQLAWLNYCKQRDLSPDAVDELQHLAWSSFSASAVDLFRQNRVLPTDITGVETTNNQISASDNLARNITLFPGSVLGRLADQFIEASVDALPFSPSLRSPGTGLNAFMNQQAMQDNYIYYIDALARGGSAVDATLMPLAANLNSRSNSVLGQSLSSAVYNYALPKTLRSYALFTKNSVLDYTMQLEENSDNDLADREKVKSGISEMKATVGNKDDEKSGPKITIKSAQGEVNSDIEKVEGIIDEPSFKATYSFSKAGVSQGQETYGKALLAYVTSVSKDKPTESTTVPVYASKMTKLEEATVDQYGRLQNTYYYDSNEEKFDKYTQHFYGPFGHQLSVTKDSTQEALPPVQQLSTSWKSAVAGYWDKLAVDFSPAVDMKPADLAKKLGVELSGDENPEVLKSKFISYVESQLEKGNADIIKNISIEVEAIAKDKSVIASESKVASGFREFIPTGKIVKDSKGNRNFVLDKNSDIFTKALPQAQESLLKGGSINMNGKDLKALQLSRDEGIALVARLDEKYVASDNTERSYKQDIEQLTNRTWGKSGKTDEKSLYAVLYAYMMLNPQADGRAWKDLTSEEKHKVLYGVTGWRLATAPLYDRDNVKQTLEKSFNNTNVTYLGSRADIIDLAKVQTIYVPGISNPGKQVKTPEVMPMPVYETVISAPSGPNYFYDLNLYSTGSGYSPYSGPALQVNAGGTDSGLADGFSQASSVSASKYQMFKNKFSSGISEFLNQITLPSWSVDIAKNESGNLVPSVNKYFYDDDTISREIGNKAGSDYELKQDISDLKNIQLYYVPNIVGNKLTFVSGAPGDNQNYYYSFYKNY
ncbi:MAG: hypothetical protein M0Q96_00760, partial [Candidatus Omnitrophica bacterium]|nr:hypothetical protein [Candidatus Omnitrophota bacterium]